MCTGEFNVRGNPAMDLRPIQGSGGRSRNTPVENDGAGLMNHLARIETSPYLPCIY